MYPLIHSWTFELFQRVDSCGREGVVQLMQQHVVGMPASLVYQEAKKGNSSQHSSSFPPTHGWHRPPQGESSSSVSPPWNPRCTLLFAKVFLISASRQKSISTCKNSNTGWNVVKCLEEFG